MDKVRGSGEGSVPPSGRAPAGDGQGAFENFLASAIATIVTIIFSWRLLMETQDSKYPPPRRLHAFEDNNDKKKLGQGHASGEQLPKFTQVDIDQKTVSKETSQTSRREEQNPPPSSLSIVNDVEQTETAAFENGKLNSGRQYPQIGSGFVLTEEVEAMWMDAAPNQYSPAAGELNENNATLNQHQQHRGGGLLPRPSWALDVNPVNVNTQTHLQSSSLLSVSDSSDDTETEGDFSSDSTLDGNDPTCRDADHSDCDTVSLTNSEEATETREFHLIGEPLGDDDSESEYCVVFNSMLEAITEEDTDELSEIERDKDMNKICPDAEEQVDNFVIPQLGGGRMNKRGDGDSDSSGDVQKDKIFDDELTSETNSIDFSIDRDVPEKSSVSSSPAVLGPFKNTQRPLVIGPHRETTLQFSQDQAKLRSGAIINTVAAVDNEQTHEVMASKLESGRARNDNSMAATNVLPATKSEFSYLERARAIIWGNFRPSDPGEDITPTVRDASSDKSSRVPLLLSERTNNSGYVPSIDTHRNREQISAQKTLDNQIEDNNYGLDRSQSNQNKDAFEEDELSLKFSHDDLSSIHDRHRGQDEDSSTNTDCDLDSLTECYNQFEKVAMDHLDQDTPDQSANKEQRPNTFHGDPNVSKESADFSSNVNRKVIPDTQSNSHTFPKANSDNNKSLSDSQHGTQVGLDGSIDSDEDQSDKLSTYSDSPLSVVSRDEKPLRGFTFVQTTNVERNYVIRNTAVNKSQRPEGAFDAAEENRSQAMLENLDEISDVSSAYSELASFDKRPSTQRHLTSPLPSRYQSAQTDIGNMGSDTSGRGGPIEERTVGKFSVRPHPSFKETELESQFQDHGRRVHHNGDPSGAISASNISHQDLKSGEPSSTNHGIVQSSEHHSGSDRYGGKNLRSPQGNSSTLDGVSQHTVYRRPNHLNLDEVADRETRDLEGNLVAFQNLRGAHVDPCHVVATSSALARRGDRMPESDLLPVGSAVASSEAYAENPYIAVARATARAATIASANAAATSATSGGSEASDDISVVVSTSCTIKKGDAITPTDTSPRTAVSGPDIKYVSKKPDLTTSQKKKMMITIEESQDPSRREYRTLECEVPKNIDGDVTAMISEAVKRIIASQSSLSHQKGSQLNTAIDHITRQVVSAYREPQEPQGYFHRRPESPRKQFVPYEGQTVKGTTIPDFRAQNTSPTLYFPPRVKQPVVNQALNNSRNYTSRPGAYLSRVINKPADPDKSVYFNDDNPIFYVTGTYPTDTGDQKPSADDVVLKVVTDKNNQPSVEQIHVSESESDMETPRMERKQYNMKDIREDDNTAAAIIFPEEKTKKKKPARPKLSQPVRSEERRYVPPESWTTSTGTHSSKDPPSTDTSDKTVKSILKSRPHSTTEMESKLSEKPFISKSKSSDAVSDSGKREARPRYLERSSPKERTKKPYKSILQTPVAKIEKKKEPRNTSSEHAGVNGKPWIPERNPKEPVVVSDIPVAIPNTRPTKIDIEFEKRKREFRVRTPSPKSNIVMVDIDIENQRKQRSQSAENLKNRLSKARPKAPSTEHIDKHWEGVSERLSRSQERMSERGFRSRGDSFSSDTSGGLRRSASMGTLPGQFFSDKRSYTSLIETDLDTGICTEIPLIRETNVDEVLAKSRSMSSLNTATSFRTFDIYSDDSHYMSTEMFSTNSNNSSEKDKLNQVTIENTVNERSKSAHELRITDSLNKLSIPEWFKTQDSASKPVHLLHTRTPPRTPIDLAPTTERKPKPLSPLEILPSKPIILNHRISRSVSKSPTSSSCSTPVNGPPSNFELPSAKLRQRRDESLSPIRIKSPQEVPPLPPRDYPQRESARDSYLRMKARASPELWEPLSAIHIPTTINVNKSTSSGTSTQKDEKPRSTVDDRANVTGQYSSQRAVDPEKRKDFITHPPRRQEEIYISRKQININTTSENSSVVSDVSAPKLPPRNYVGESSDSGMGSMVDQQRYEKSQYAPMNNSSFSPGRTVSNLVRDLNIDPSQVSPQHDSEIDTGSPNGAFKQMMTTLDSKRQEIEEKAVVISTKTPEMDRPKEIAEDTRNKFPVLSLTSSPGTKRRSFRSSESVRSAKQPEPSNVTVTLSKQTFKAESQNEAKILDAKNKSMNSLDEVLGGLLAIPPPSGNPDDEEELDEDLLDRSDTPEETSKEKNFKILKKATTPRGSELSLRSPIQEENQDDEEETDYDEAAIVIQCRNSQCGKSTRLPEARQSYKTCHNCFTYYCSRDCRKDHWERHKKKCLFSRINSGCKHIIKQVQNNDVLAEKLSKIARTGYLTRGRGCVMLVFPSPLDADRFLMKGFEAVGNVANYATIREVQEAGEIFGEHETELLQNCKSYNPELRYVVEVAIVAGQDVPVWPKPRRGGPVIQKCAKLRLHSHAAAKESSKKDSEQTTLILTAVPGAEFTENMEERKAREICLVNIQGQLRQRGVSLRHQFPDVYKRLCAYVADNQHFSPISLYPIDSSTGKRFMCLIMPNSEPEVNWMYNPDLVEDLNLHTQI